MKKAEVKAALLEFAALLKVKSYEWDSWKDEDDFYFYKNIYFAAYNPMDIIKKIDDILELLNGSDEKAQMNEMLELNNNLPSFTNAKYLDNTWEDAFFKSWKGLKAILNDPENNICFHPDYYFETLLELKLPLRKDTYFKIRNNFYSMEIDRMDFVNSFKKFHDNGGIFEANFFRR